MAQNACRRRHLCAPCAAGGSDGLCESRASSQPAGIRECSETFWGGICVARRALPCNAPCNPGWGRKSLSVRSREVSNRNDRAYVPSNGCRGPSREELHPHTYLDVGMGLFSPIKCTGVSVEMVPGEGASFYVLTRPATVVVERGMAHVL